MGLFGHSFFEKYESIFSTKSKWKIIMTWTCSINRKLTSSLYTKISTFLSGTLILLIVHFRVLHQHLLLYIYQMGGILLVKLNANTVCPQGWHNDWPLVMNTVFTYVCRLMIIMWYGGQQRWDRLFYCLGFN